MLKNAVIMDKYLRSFYSAINDYQKGFRHRLPDSCRDSFPKEYRKSREELHDLVDPDEAADLLGLEPDKLGFKEISRIFVRIKNYDESRHENADNNANRDYLNQISRL